MERDRKAAHPRHHYVRSGPDLTQIPQTVIDRSAASALSKLSASSGAQGQGQGRHGAQESPPPPNLIYNHKHLQYVPPPKRSPVMTNGRTTHHPPPLYAPPPARQPLTGPMTKSVGVGVNLNYPRGGGTRGAGQAVSQHSQAHMHSSSSSRPDPSPQGQGHRSDHGPASSSLGPSSSSTNSTIRTHFGKSGPGTTPAMPASLSSAQADLFSSHKGNGNKIVSQNLNGTLSVTGVPSNDSELQLFRVLQRANLLNYFDVMIELGGDDVQQLCDAGEEEFLEIMALIGMASKPLHVRRLQKSLQEWMTQPNLFPGPILGPPLSAFTGGGPPSPRNGAPPPNPTTGPSAPTPGLPIRPIPFHSGPGPSHSSPAFLSPQELKSLQLKFHAMKSAEGGGESSSQRQSPAPAPPPLGHPYLTAPAPSPLGHSGSPAPPAHYPNTPSVSSPSPALYQNLPSVSSPGPALYSNLPNVSSPCSSSSSSTGSTGSHSYTLPNGLSLRIPSDQIIPSHFLETRLRTRSEPNSPGPDSPAGQGQLESRASTSPIPFLQDHEVQKIQESAMRVLQSLPDYMGEPRVTAKRKSSADFETVIRLSEDDPNKMDEVRKYAAIYGRYDCKRKVQKPLTIHELSVNEAASQLCKHIPALLTRREELLLLSRQVIRDAGLPYSSIITLPPGNGSGLHGSYNGRLQYGSRNEEVQYGSPSPGPLQYANANGKKLNLGDGMEVQEYNRPRSVPEPKSQPDEVTIVSLRPGSGPAAITMLSRSSSPNDLVTNSRKRSGSFLSPGSSHSAQTKDRRVEEVPETENVEPDDLSLGTGGRRPRPNELYNTFNNNNHSSHSVKPEPNNTHLSS